MRTSSEEMREETQQKGPYNSGQILADIFSRQAASAETSFLDDHAYTLFEERLVSDERIDVVTGNGETKPTRPFLKIEGRIRFNDMRAAAHMLKNFNSLGLALWRVLNQPMLSTEQHFASDKEARKSAAQQGMQLNEKVTEAAAEVMDFGFRDLFEIYLDAGDFRVSAPLKREFLRESEGMLVHKYSRVPDAKFFVVGMITRSGWDQIEDSPLPNVIDADNPRGAMRHLSLHMNELEQVYTSIGSDELIIEPIAIYREI